MLPQRPLLEQLALTRAMLDAPGLQFFNAWGPLSTAGVEGPPVLVRAPGIYICCRAGDAMRARGWDPEKEARRPVSIDVDFRADVLRAVAEHRVGEASCCPRRRVNAYPQVVRGPNDGGLIPDFGSPAGLVAPSI
jgi:hypothetical protein